MKKLAALLLALALLLSLAACGGNNGSADLEENGTPKHPESPGHCAGAGTGA